MKRAREAVNQFGDDVKKVQLNDTDHRAGTLGQAVNESIERIEALLASGVIINTTGAIKVRAAVPRNSKAGSVPPATERQLAEGPRRLSEIVSAIDELFDKVSLDRQADAACADGAAAGRGDRGGGACPTLNSGRRSSNRYLLRVVP
jgi:hypothetical protein